jgi:hypothetical protein
LLEEVRGLYNEKYRLDHIDDVGCEVGQDADGLLWVRHDGPGVQPHRSQVDELGDLLEEVKNLYNERFPYDHVDDQEREVGHDGDGLLWVRYTGRQAEIREAKINELWDLLDEVKGMYNNRFPLDHVDSIECESGHDSDGLLWVQHTGHGVALRSGKMQQLEDLLEEVKGLYNQKYPDDHADGVGNEIGYDEDGLLWVKYSGHSRVDDLFDLLEEVKCLYNEAYPLDHVNDEDHELGCDSDGLVWTRHSGQGRERSRLDRLGDLLQEVKGLYNQRFPEDHVDDAACDAGYDADGMPWVELTGQGVERSEVEKLEELLAEVQVLYNMRHPWDHVDNAELEFGTDVDGLLWAQWTGQGLKSWDAKVGRLEELLEEVKAEYNRRYPEDHADDDDREVGVDADGLRWFRYEGLGAEAERWQREVAKLEDLLSEVQDLYNRRYPHDHAEDAGHEVGTDADGLLWVRYTGDAAQNRDLKMGELQDLLAEVRGLYCQRYPLDDIDDMAHEAGIDANGLHWVSFTGQGSAARARKVQELERLLEEARALYNEKYPLDHVDDEDAELGRDADGLLWVRYSGRSSFAQRAEHLEGLLEEVKCLYGERFPLDEVSDLGREIGYDADGLLWVRHTGPALSGAARDEAEAGSGRHASKMESLQHMLAEVRRLYQERYPLDCVDDLGAEAGQDADDLLWVKYTGEGCMCA